MAKSGTVAKGITYTQEGLKITFSWEGGKATTELKRNETPRQRWQSLHAAMLAEANQSGKMINKPGKRNNAKK
jgi:hypothetical protein